MKSTCIRALTCMLLLLMLVQAKIARSQEPVAVIKPFYGVLHRKVMFQLTQEPTKARYVRIIEFGSARNRLECEAALKEVKRRTVKAVFVEEDCTQELGKEYRDVVDGLAKPSAMVVTYDEGELASWDIFILPKDATLAEDVCDDIVRGYSKTYKNVGCVIPIDLGGKP